MIRKIVFSKFRHYSLRNLCQKNGTISVKWKKKDGSVISTMGNVGENLMRLAHRYGVELEGNFIFVIHFYLYSSVLIGTGACEGVCACSTCHVILEDNVYDKLPEPLENEDDMLDQAPGLTSTSRLGCQVVLSNDLNGILVSLPSITRNFYVVSQFFF
jgi:hypothetical protein